MGWKYTLVYIPPLFIIPVQPMLTRLYCPIHNSFLGSKIHERNPVQSLLTGEKGQCLISTLDLTSDEYGATFFSLLNQ